MTTPGFIFMLTREDRTVPDARARLDEALAAGIPNIGFKDVGLPMAELEPLHRAIKAAGATTFLEVVSLDRHQEVQSAMVARRLGTDYLLGGTRPEAVLPVIDGSAIRYCPFPGQVSGHPSVLQGTIAEIVADARRLCTIPGVYGLDLLAYRFEGDVPALMQAVCKAVPCPVIMAGSIDRPERIAAAARAGAAGFTVGTAALNGDFPAAATDLTSQLRAIAKVAGRCWP